jgi:amicyanin
MTAQQKRPAAIGQPAVPAAVAGNTGHSNRNAASSENTTAGESVTVRINGMRFEPANITVKPGTTVTWVHESRMPHTVSSQSGMLRSSTLYTGQKFSHTFDAEGRYDYLCDLHPSMKGSVVVEDTARDS